MNKFSARFATQEERQNWDENIWNNPDGGNWVQSQAFSEVKPNWGWDTKEIVFEGPYTSYALVLEKKFPLLGTYWYFVKGPSAENVEDIPAMMQAVEKLNKDEELGIFGVKTETDIIDSPENKKVLEDAGFKKTFNVQPNDHTAILDTDIPVNKLFGAIGSRARNSIKKAEKGDVEVVPVELSEDNMRSMYQMMGTVQQGKSTAQLRPFEYYKQFWKAFEKKGQGRMYFVYEDGKPSVGAYVIGYGNRGTYKDGGSVPHRKQSGDAHILQWRAIKDLKEDFDIVDYDFCGTPASDKAKDENESFYGMGLFKTSFTKDITDYMGSYDYAFDPMKYAIWDKIGEKVFRQLYFRQNNSPFY